MDENLVKLQELTDEAIKAAEKSDNNFAVNWADLQCITACECKYVDGSKGYQVTIEEASPGETDFQHWIARYLEKRGFENIVVITEW
jgi:hypothetical protein